ncbi:Cellulose synthase, partial [Cynara cardunculus var. scolymus]
MFYALLETSCFCKYWLPFCKRYKIEPRSPSAYFTEAHISPITNEWSSIKPEELTEELKKEHRGFKNGKSVQANVTIRLLSNAIDTEGNTLPALVYMAREKRPEWHHSRSHERLDKGVIADTQQRNYSKYGLRHVLETIQNPYEMQCVFSWMSRRASGLCSYNFHRTLTTSQQTMFTAILQGSSMRLEVWTLTWGAYMSEVGAFTGEMLCVAEAIARTQDFNWDKENHKTMIEGIDVLEKACKILAICTYEQNTRWGKEMGLKYGCAVEDVINGIAIKCRGWRSVPLQPRKKRTLIQTKRWAEGDFQIFLSKYCPLVYGHGRIPLKLQISYCCYLLWALNCWATLYYVVVPSYCLLRGISLFPKLSSYWFLPFAYVFVGKYAYSLGEFYWTGETLKGWWNDQRMWLYRRLTSYLFAFFDVVLKSMGFTNTNSIITSKVADEDASQRYNREIMEFGATFPMFNILSTLALVNLFSFLKGVNTDDPVRFNSSHQPAHIPRALPSEEQWSHALLYYLPVNYFSYIILYISFYLDYNTQKYVPFHLLPRSLK